MSENKEALSIEQFMEESKTSYLEKNRGYMTASKLKLLSQCPWTYNEKYEKENNEFKEEETKSLGMGNQVDFFASYGEEAFYKKYEILEPKVKRDFTADKTQITNGDGKKLLPIFDELKRQPLFKLMDKGGTRQHKIKGKFETPDGDVEILGTPDTIFYGENWIDDTKTVAVQGSQSFERACKNNIEKYDYVFSMTFYAVLFYIENEKLPEKLTLSFVGTNGGYKFLQYEIPKDVWMPKIEHIRELLCFYAKCKAEKNWPNYSEVNNEELFRHLNCPFYSQNPGAIQSNPIPYFDEKF